MFSSLSLLSRSSDDTARLVVWLLVRRCAFPVIASPSGVGQINQAALYWQYACLHADCRIHAMLLEFSARCVTQTIRPQPVTERQWGSNGAPARRDVVQAPTWFQQTYPQSPLRCVACLSMEFMLGEILPVCPGGQGISA